MEEGGVHHIYKPLITAGIAFGAKRWIAILNGYCQRVLATNVASPPVAGTNYLGHAYPDALLPLYIYIHIYDIIFACFICFSVC